MVRVDNSLSQGPAWMALMSRYIHVIPPKGSAEQKCAGDRPFSSAMIEKEGAAERHRASAVIRNGFASFMPLSFCRWLS